jgi:hypothetical protein
LQLLTPTRQADLVLTFRARTALLLSALAVSLPATTAGAAVIASSARGFEGGPALAADGRVVVAERAGSGALRFLAIDPVTRAVTPLSTTAPIDDALTYNEVSVSGSGAAVTATVQRWREATGPQSGPEQDIPVPRGSRSTTLLPGVFTVFECPRRQPFSEPDAVAGDGFVASIGDECGYVSATVTIHTAGTTLRIAATPDTTPQQFGDPPTPNITALRASGPMVAWTEERREVPGGVISRAIVVARGATGQVLLRAPIPSYPYQFGLGADGTVAFTGLGCAIGVVSPAAPVLRAIKLAPQLCPYSASGRSLALSGDLVVLGASTGYVASDLQGAARPLADARPRGGNVKSPVVLAGRTAYVLRPDCDADRLLAVDVDAPAGPLPTTDSGLGQACPLRRAGTSRPRVAGGRVRIALRCAHGCRGTLRLVQQRRGRRERLIGQAAYSHGPGTAVVRVPVAGYARSLAGCSAGLRANAVVFPGGSSRYSRNQRGLGAYRIRSAARCRRTGGPPFAAPRRGPRP